MKDSRDRRSTGEIPENRLQEILPEGEREVCVALGFANTRGVAMGNLGFHIVRQQLSSYRGFLVEQFFLPEIPLPLPRGSLTTEPDGRALSSTDLVLLSISFEGDAINVPAMLTAGGLPAFAHDRRQGHPLVIGGGAMVMINPEPIAAFFDIFLIGEAEEMLPSFMETWVKVKGAPRSDQLEAFEELPGVLIPSRRKHHLWSPSSEGPHCDRQGRWPERAVSGDQQSEPELTDADQPVSSIPWRGFSPDAGVVRLPAEYDQGPGLLLELARGCPRRCRFCAASRIYKPLRQADPPPLLDRARQKIQPGETVGLLALSAGDYCSLETLTTSLIETGARLSISSLPATFSRSEVAKQIVASGAKTLTLAPETGTDRLRSLVGKPMRNDDILQAVTKLGEAGVRRLRTYFIIGLPFEEEADIDGIGDLLAAMRLVLPGSCALSATVNAFTPKPRTPFQWAPMAPLPLLRQRAAQLKAICPKGVRLRIKSFREARVQTLLARGDISWGRSLANLAERGTGSVESALRGDKFDPKIMYGEISISSPLPWGYLISDQIIGLKKEWREIWDQTSRQ